MIIAKKIFVVIIALGVASTVLAQREVAVGANAGVFLPTNSTTRDLFGTTWISFGFSPLSFQTAERWKGTLDVSVLSKPSGNNKVFLLPVTAGVTTAFGKDDESEMIPYFAVRAGFYYGHVRSPFMGIDKTGGGFNANATLGVSFQKKFYVETRYDYFSDFEGLDFSGLWFSAGVRLFNIRL